MGRKRKKKFKARHKPKQPELKLSGKEASQSGNLFRTTPIARLRSSIENLEREYKQGKITEAIYERLKAEYEEKIEKTEQPTVLSRISIYNVLLVAIVALAFYIRVVLPWDSIFVGDLIRVAADDAVYHMRLVENTVHNFPHRIFFDPFTHFPYGAPLHFGPLFTWIVAIIAFVVEAIIGGGGIPTRRTIELVGAFLPAVGGTLVVLATYFVAKEIFDDRRIGLLSALILAVMPGQFLSRTILGFADHHVLEILFGTTTILFFIMAIKRAEELRFEHVLNRDWNVLKTPLMYSALAGLMLGFFLLSWPGAPMFAFIIVVYAVAQFAANHMKNISSDGLCIVGMTTFVFPPVMAAHIILEGVGQYGRMHILSFILGILVFLVLSIVPRIMERQNISRSHYPFVLMGIGTVGLGSMYLFSPALFGSLFGAFGIFMPVGGALTIAEVQPMFFRGGEFTLMLAWFNFTTTLYIGLIAMVMLGYRVMREWRAPETLLLVWSIATLLATFSQNRFGYYLAVNLAILSGYFGIKLLEFGGLGALYENFKKRVSDSSDLSRFISRYVKLGHVLVVVLVALLLIYPNLGITVQAARHGPGVDWDWYSALVWMRYNTPDPGVDYYGIYEAPLPGERFSYPEGAYSVMSWWDYGHIITYYARRIPNANPFQAGIGGPGPNGTIIPGASTFFTATNESTANWILDELGTRYVITDISMATGKFWAMATFAEGDTSRFFGEYFIEEITPEGVVLRPVKPGDPFLYYPDFYRSMVTRLHIFRGEEVIPDNSTWVISYEERTDGRVTFRVVTSSQLFPTYTAAREFIAAQDLPNYRIVGASPFISPVPLEGLEHYRLVYESPTMVGMIEGREIRQVKIFEYVP
ncbi:MAG: oligosaccharyl transferase, archaeosortase A system-associated [Methanosarcinales archaeon Met12]|nr:MAG: oligosaccharyl transferase, archaeosortase A system-associated [Methanosarcinales archaeon Met12]